MTDAPELSDLIAKSKQSDLATLLQVKEDTRRVMLEDKSPANIAAFNKALRMLDVATENSRKLKDWRDVLAYMENNGRKLKKTKLYDDIGKGRLRKQADGTFKLRDVERYAATLPVLGGSDKVVEDAAKRQRRKEEAEIRRIEATAKRDEFRHDVECGKYIARDLVFQELAGRAIAMDAGLRTKFESRVLEYIHLVDGSPKKASNLVQILCEDLDAVMNEFSQIETFELLIVPAEAPADVDSEDIT